VTCSWVGSKLLELPRTEDSGQQSPPFGLVALGRVSCGKSFIRFAATGTCALNRAYIPASFRPSFIETRRSEKQLQEQRSNTLQAGSRIFASRAEHRKHGGNHSVEDATSDDPDKGLRRDALAKPFVNPQWHPRQRQPHRRIWRERKRGLCEKPGENQRSRTEQQEGNIRAGWRRREQLVGWNLGPCPSRSPRPEEPCAE
jgi:hypothetical protein